MVDPEALRDPQGYLAGADLSAAVDVALTLGMPLLLTGEPGCGKSRLAHSVAWELGLERPLEFSVKSDMQGRDLFYSFDTVGRFHASQAGKGDADPGRFLSFNALGKAILHAKPLAYAVDELKLPGQRVDHPGEPRRSVVLIDEIDKAPRDVPNDLLTEVEGMSFRIPEMSAAGGREVEVALEKSENRFRPIVIITSNSEKSLPDPFLRRCVYYHVPFPEFAENSEDGGQDDRVTVEEIVASRLGARFRVGDPFIADAIGLFRYLRDPRHGLERRPSLAELLNWLDLLLRQGVKVNTLAELGEDALLLGVETLLLKKQNDQLRAPDLIEPWRGAREE